MLLAAVKEKKEINTLFVGSEIVFFPILLL